MPGEVLVVVAAYVLPVTAPPVHHGAVAIEDGRIVAVGPAAVVKAIMNERVSAGRTRHAPTVRHLGHVAILPGLVNAHTHLELSWLHGQVPPAPALPAWVRSVLAARRATGGDDAAAVVPALSSAREAGTAAVGDIGNGTSAYATLNEAAFDAVAFHEIIGFAPEDPEGLVDAVSQWPRHCRRVERSGRLWRRTLHTRCTPRSSRASGAAERFGEATPLLKHPYFAALTVRQWCKFHRRHTLHHLRQVRARARVVAR